MRLSDDDFIDLVTALGERRNLEFKPGGHRSGYHLAQVARAALGLANLRDGGVIILGVAEVAPGIFEPQGIAADALDSWANNDDVTSALTSFADPAFSLERHIHEFEDMRFVVIQVREFDAVPIICKKGYKDQVTQKQVLQSGQCYVRGTRKPESVSIPSLMEMRELFDLATEKGVRRFVTQARAAGLNLAGAAIPTDDDYFKEELRDLDEGKYDDELLKNIRSRGYWRVVIRPVIYDKSRIPQITTLYPLIFERSVRLRGWDFPQVNTQTEPHIDLTWVGKGSAYHSYLEYWRFYQSGQFVDYFAMAEDWRLEQGRRGIPSEEDTGLYLPIDDTIITFAEIFEFAARLALTEAYTHDGLVHIEIALHGLKERQLYVDDSRKTRLYTTRKATLQSFPYSVDLQREDLIANSRGHAIEAAIQLFHRFNWQPGLVSLTPVLDKLRY